MPFVFYVKWCVAIAPPMVLQPWVPSIPYLVIVVRNVSAVYVTFALFLSMFDKQVA